MSAKTELRKEYDRLRDNGTLARECGVECVSCGSTENIEYHHIVPLLLGGTNRFTNIVPICHQCHKAAHGSHHMSRYADSSNSGRKPKVPDEVGFKALDLMVAGEIGVLKAIEMMGLYGGSKPNQTAQYERWTKLRGIKYMRNHLDYSVSTSPMKISDGYIVGTVEYTDGRTEPIRFHDTGLNDDVTYSFLRGKDRHTNTWGEEKKKRTKRRVVVTKHPAPDPVPVPIPEKPISARDYLDIDAETVKKLCGMAG